MNYVLGLFLLSSAVLAQEFQTGFYRVEGPSSCVKEFGPMVFMNSESIKTSSECSFVFENNDMRTVGICTRVLSHRGDTRNYPSNTIGAFDSALNQGFRGIELDVWISKDKKAIVSHDNNLRAGTNCRGKIVEKNSDEILSCVAERTSLIPEWRFLSKKAKIKAPVPSLKEVLQKYKDDKRAEQIVIDVKQFPAGKDLIEALKDAFPTGSEEELMAFQQRLTFISQDPQDVILVKEAFPYSHVAFESNKTVSGLIDTPDADLWSEECVNDTLSVSFNSLFDFKLKLVKFLAGQNLAPKKKFNQLYQNNLNQENTKRILGWTINNKAGVRGLRDFNIQDALTDMPYAEVMDVLLKDTPEEELKKNLEGIKSGESGSCE